MFSPFNPFPTSALSGTSQWPLLVAHPRWDVYPKKFFFSSSHAIWVCCENKFISLAQCGKHQRIKKTTLLGKPQSLEWEWEVPMLVPSRRNLSGKCGIFRLSIPLEIRNSDAHLPVQASPHSSSARLWQQSSGQLRSRVPDQGLWLPNSYRNTRW